MKEVQWVGILRHKDIERHAQVGTVGPAEYRGRSRQLAPQEQRPGGRKAASMGRSGRRSLLHSRGFLSSPQLFTPLPFPHYSRIPTRKTFTP